MKKVIKKVIPNKNENEMKLRNQAFCNMDELIDELSTSKNGLSSLEVEEKQEAFGTNVITVGKKNNTWTRLREAVINPFNLVLLVIAAITFLTDVILASKKDFLTVSIILVLVIISSLVAFIQSERSNQAAEKLSKMISNKVTVIRDNMTKTVSFDDIVAGDIIKLSAGDMIPADVRFITTKDAFVAQASLTGESNPVEKYSEIKNMEEGVLTSISNLGFMGSNMVSGSATAVVLAIGNDTYFGSMAKTLSGDRAKNSFERGVNSVSKLLMSFMIVMVPIVFLINGVTKGDWMQSLFFAITIAVGLTPEMLPVIITSTLAKGAVSMSKHNVIVKNLGSIQTFGEMDILCTDKTGTLTEDKIVLEKYMNIHGEDDQRILRHAYLNSYFQTGLKNLIDIAIINRANENKLDEYLENYTCVDEIPFDFSRRRMSVILKDNNNKNQLITKGAVEEVMSICSYLEYQGEIYELDDAKRKVAYETYEKFNHEGLRMVAVAQKNNISNIDEFSVADEKDMVLIGFVGFLDPPKESAKEAITALQDHGVRVIVLTGDSEGVAIKVCKKVGVNVSSVLTGKDVSEMNDEELKNAVRTCDLFAKLSPMEKERVVKALQVLGHTVGYMGDGINDALPLRQADVGISVDSAVDIAKETADIILLKKDLLVLEEGVIEGRKTFGNIMKYIKMTASGNFGNIISVIAASVFLPFLPMLPVQILTQNLLCDFSQMGIPFDNVDEEYIKRPRKWETKSIKRFMAIMGPFSTLFDILMFMVMWWALGANTANMAPLFQSGWFVFGTVSQILIIHMIRTVKIPFVQSIPSFPLVISTAIVVVVSIIIGFTDIAIGLDMARLPLSYGFWLVLLIVGYCMATQIIKKLYVKHFKEWF